MTSGRLARSRVTTAVARSAPTSTHEAAPQARLTWLGARSTSGVTDAAAHSLSSSSTKDVSSLTMSGGLESMTVTGAMGSASDALLSSPSWVGRPGDEQSAPEALWTTSFAARITSVGRALVQRTGQPPMQSTGGCGVQLRGGWSRTVSSDEGDMSLA